MQMNSKEQQWEGVYMLASVSVHSKGKKGCCLFSPYTGWKVTSIQSAESFCGLSQPWNHINGSCDVIDRCCHGESRRQQERYFLSFPGCWTGHHSIILLQSPSFLAEMQDVFLENASAKIPLSISASLRSFREMSEVVSLNFG